MVIAPSPYEPAVGAASALIRKLERFAPLQEDERAALVEAAQRVRRLMAGETLAHESGPTGGLTLIASGLAYRYKILPDGRRSILGFSVPGDVCDLPSLLLDRMDHSIAVCVQTTVATLSRESVNDLLERHPGLVRGLWRSTLVDAAISREWVVNIGQRTALERLAHLFCELYHRLRAVGLAGDGLMELPITQTDLADSLGLSSVHVNRTLQELRRSRLLALRGKSAEILDLEGLEDAGSFHAGYLHLDRSDPMDGRRR